MSARALLPDRFVRNTAVVLTVILFAIPAQSAELDGVLSFAQPEPSETVQPPAEVDESMPPVAPAAPSSDISALLADYRASRRRLASIPSMFGDTVAPPIFVGTTNVPLAGHARRTEVGENNKAVPEDRVYFAYNYFDSVAIGGPTEHVLNRFTLGWEKTFLDELWSVELRMPYTYSHYFGRSSIVSVDDSYAGNLSVIVKRVIHEDDCLAVALGLGIDLPTGVDATVGGVTIENDTVFLSPYLAISGRPTDRLYYNGFLQLDIPTSGHPVSTGGEFNEQTLLRVDLGGGYWFYRNPCPNLMVGAASFVEFHYTSSLEGSDVVPVPNSPPVTGGLGEFDIVNLTFGVHTEWIGGESIRLGGSLPLNQRDRLFDAELGVQVNIRY